MKCFSVFNNGFLRLVCARLGHALEPFDIRRYGLFETDFAPRE